MKIQSEPVRPDPFQKIAITIVIETDQDARALQLLCQQGSRICSGPFAHPLQRFLDQLKPHVTPA